MATSLDPNAKVTVVLVSPENGRPMFAVKAPTTDDAARAVEAEGHLLAALGRLPRFETFRTIPRVADIVEFNGRSALVMTAVQGMPMSTYYLRPRHARSPERVAADFAAAEVWLAGFQTGTAGQPARLDMDGSVTSRLRARFAADADLAADLDRLGAIHARLARNTVPRTAVHGDLWFGNLLVTDARVSGVVDWEAGAVSGEPVRDLVRFAHMYALYLARRTRPGRRVRGHPGLRAGAWGIAVEYALAGEGWFPELFRRFLADGLARLGASRDDWRHAALAGIAEVAALTDNPEFARRHLELFRRLSHPRAGLVGTR
jgi:aminoglycoside phosphotransferase (APT) family kinase protein